MVAIHPQLELPLGKKASVNTSRMEIKAMTNNERRTLFIEKTQALKDEGLTYKQIAPLIDMNYKRMKNIRSTKPPHVFPSVIELESLMELYKQRFPETDKPSSTDRNREEIEMRLDELEARIKAQEAFNQAKRMSLIERLINLAEQKMISREELDELKKLIDR